MEVWWATTGDKGGARTGKRWVTDFVFSQDDTKTERSFLLDEERLWIHKQCSQLFALLTGDGGKTSAAVSCSMAIKPTQWLCFLLLLAYHSNIGFYRMSDQTRGIIRKYYYNRRDNSKTEQRENGNKFPYKFYSQHYGDWQDKWLLPTWLDF